MMTNFVKHTGKACHNRAYNGNKNALRHGLYSAEAKAINKHVRDLLRKGRLTNMATGQIKELEAGDSLFVSEGERARYRAFRSQR